MNTTGNSDTARNDPMARESMSEEEIQLVRGLFEISMKKNKLGSEKELFEKLKR